MKSQALDCFRDYYAREIKEENLLSLSIYPNVDCVLHSCCIARDLCIEEKAGYAGTFGTLLRAGVMVQRMVNKTILSVLLLRDSYGY